jgi:hypothetical protein
MMYGFGDEALESGGVGGNEAILYFEDLYEQAVVNGLRWICQLADLEVLYL